MGSNFGRQLKISVFGQSHSEGIGVVADGFPAGFKIDRQRLSSFMQRRAPGHSPFATPRKEADELHILSGIVGDVTCGAPFCAVIQNIDTRSADYRSVQHIPRPAHADFSAQQKFHGYQDVRGGGHFSGRLTAPLTAAGGIAVQMLESQGIFVGTHISSIADIRDQNFDPVLVCPDDFEKLRVKHFPCLCDEAAQQMQQAILQARSDGDSVGGTIECAVTGMPAGIGSPMFDGLENRIAAAVFAIPAVKGIEFGSGFAGAAVRGSENNDAFTTDAAGNIRTRTNHHGGILGGISSGMPILFRIAMKPTPSIGREQKSVNMKTKQEVSLTVGGRHDPCVVVRAAVCVEAVTALTLLDMLLSEGQWQAPAAFEDQTVVKVKDL